MSVRRHPVAAWARDNILIGGAVLLFFALVLVVALALLVGTFFIAGWGVMSWSSDGANPLNVTATIVGLIGCIWFIVSMGRSEE